MLELKAFYGGSFFPKFTLIDHLVDKQVSIVINPIRTDDLIHLTHGYLNRRNMMISCFQCCTTITSPSLTQSQTGFIGMASGLGAKNKYLI